MKILILNFISQDFFKNRIKMFWIMWIKYFRDFYNSSDLSPMANWVRKPVRHFKIISEREFRNFLYFKYLNERRYKFKSNLNPHSDFENKIFTEACHFHQKWDAKKMIFGPWFLQIRKITDEKWYERTWWFWPDFGRFDHFEQHINLF